MSLRAFLGKNRIEISLLFLLIIGLGLKFYRLNNPRSYYFDEIYFAFTAEEMVKGNRAAWELGHEAPSGFAYEWTHPQFGKEMSALGILIFGDKPFGWRFFQALFGGFGTLVIYTLGKELFESKRAGIIAAFLFTFESFIFVLSRIAMVDIFLMVFILLSSLFLVKYVKTSRVLFLIISGVFAGTAVSTKWNGLYAVEFIGFIAFIVILYREWVVNAQRNISSILKLLWVIPIFILIPLGVYTLVHLPFFLYGNSIGDFIYLQKSMYGYHKGLNATHPYASSWWGWPLLLRPVYLYFESLGQESAHIYTIGNPLIWWTGCAFLLWGVIEVIRKELPGLAFATLSVFAYWLPWALSPRKLVFIYHFLPSLPFIILIIAYFLDLAWARSRYGRAFVVVYLVAALGMIVYFYPIIAAIPVSNDSLSRFFWLKSWR
jgi:dolichyl-phosphate-mannose-protein mannosyltransferase